jgi:hypothetical protein
MNEKENRTTQSANPVNPQTELLNFARTAEGLGNFFELWLHSLNFTAIEFFLANAPQMFPGFDFSVLRERYEKYLSKAKPTIEPSWLPLVEGKTLTDEKQPERESGPAPDSAFAESVYLVINQLETKLKDPNLDPAERNRIEKHLQDEYDSLK